MAVVVVVAVIVACMIIEVTAHDWGGNTNVGDLDWYCGCSWVKNMRGG